MKNAIMVIIILLLVLILELTIIISFGVSINTNIDLKDYNKSLEIIENQNKNIKLDINKLDSVQNEEIEKAKTVNNDSALRMFYQLIRKK